MGNSAASSNRHIQVSPSELHPQLANSLSVRHGNASRHLSSVRSRETRIRHLARRSQGTFAADLRELPIAVAVSNPTAMRLLVAPSLNMVFLLTLWLDGGLYPGADTTPYFIVNGSPTANRPCAAANA
ncbi:hypothetical protein PGQ11_001847 [Apiospora arundinis]|uniref:Uncharacterized protein n=1 Tax=Apiospora arundinis TaxID=335852 RepID=A0ABR2JGC2_9PEZI